MFPPKPPNFNTKTNISDNPHVVIIGAGASLAALPKGDSNNYKIPLMNNLVEIVGLEKIIASYNIKYKNENFEDIYDKLASSTKYSNLVNEIEDMILNYFSQLQLPEMATIYDYLVLSLREKDIIATFNWDPFLAQAFARNMNIVGYNNMPKIAYLHGNVAIGVCYKCERVGWRYNRCEICNNHFLPSKLLFPVSRKDYTNDLFVSKEWEKIQEYIKESYLLTIFGYGAPETDIEAKALLLNGWEKNELRDYALIDVIDIKTRDQITSNWKSFFANEEYRYKYFSTKKDFFDSYLAYHPRRSCEADIMARLQQSPWRDNPLPKNVSLAKLQQYILQLIEEERAEILNDTVFV